MVLENWVDKQDGIDDILAEDINSIANAVIETQREINQIVIDQTYTPESENAQSGKAVNEAINTAAAIIPGEGTDSIKQNYPGNSSYGDRSVSIGPNVNAYGENSVGIGYRSNIYNQNGVSLGYDNKNYSHVGITAGYENIAGLPEYANKLWGEDIARGAIAVGWENRATHANVCVFGNHNNSSRDNQAVFGRFCADDPNALFIVGNGTGLDKRSNLYTIDKDGNACFTGGVYIGSSKKDGAGSKRLATEEYADNAVKDKIERKRADNTFSNALKGSKSGSAILIDDISPVNHDMTVKISSDTVTDLTAVKVTRCGKNLLYNDTIISESTNPVKKKIWSGNLPAPFVFSEDLSQFTPTEGLASAATFNLKLADGTVKVIGKDYEYLLVRTGILKEIYFVNNSEGIGTIKCQLEIGRVKTDYEPYVEPTYYTPNADGIVNGVTSLYPSTTLMTDTEGVIIDCEYNRDINKAFAALEAAIVTNNS